MYNNDQYVTKLFCCYPSWLYSYQSVLLVCRSNLEKNRINFTISIYTHMHMHVEQFRRTFMDSCAASAASNVAGDEPFSKVPSSNT